MNRHTIALKKVDRSGRTHDQLRADIAADMLMGEDTLNRGGTVDIRVDLTTLAALDEGTADLGGMEPVVAQIARQVADRSHRAEWRTVVTNNEGQVVDVSTTKRRPNRALSRFVESTQPTCSFPGCRVPASECDFDHLSPWSEGGPTTASNGGPKCRHDHILRDHGWTHDRVAQNDRWISPLGHTYITQGQSP